MLRRLGVRRGDVVACILPNMPETHWTIWGAETACIAFAVNPLLEAPMMRELLMAANARGLVTVAPGDVLWDKVSACAVKVASLQGALAINTQQHRQVEERGPASLGALPVHDFATLLAAAHGAGPTESPTGA